MAAIQSFVKSTRGATAIEYALIASLIAIAIIGALTVFGETRGAMYDAIATAISGA